MPQGIAEKHVKMCQLFMYSQFIKMAHALIFQSFLIQCSICMQIEMFQSAIY